MYDYLIVGSGLFGSIFAYEANKRGYKCLVLEKREHIGGNIYTENHDGINIHKYGAHIFHTSKLDVWNYINQFAHFNNFINSPIAIYKDEMYNLPFNMNTFSKMWNITKPEEAKIIIEGQRKAITEINNLEDQAISLVGQDIYEKLIKGYTEKQWGRSCKELPPSIIKRLPVRYTYDNNYFNDIYQGIPLGGYTQIIEKLLDGVEVRLNIDFNLDQKKYKSLAKKIVYTGALDAYYNYSLGHLEYRSVKFENEKLSCDNYQGVAVVNYTQREIPYTRIIEHKHFEKADSKVTYISKEYPVDYSVTNEPYYPINDEKNSKLYSSYLELSKKEKNLLLGGRLALYSYFDMDKTIEEALKLINAEL